MNSKFPMIIFPAFQLQDEIQAFTVGTHRWVRLVEDIRMRISLEQYMQLHDGQLPLQSCMTVTMSCGKDKRYKRYNLQKPIELGS